jgi:STE24 endopeptidase
MKKDATTFGGFTTQAKTALKAAQEEAQRLGYTSVDPEHLLLGLTADSTNSAVKLLHALGTAPEAVRAAGEALVQPGAQTVAEARLSSRTEQVIEFTVAEVRRLRSNTTDTDHLVLGILREEQGSACKLLNSLGVSLDIARAEAERIQNERIMNSLSSRSGAVQLDSERQQQAVALARSRQRISFTYLSAIIVFFVLFIAAEITFPQFSTLIVAPIFSLESAPLLSWQLLAGWMPLLVLLYCILVSVFCLAFVLPLAWLTGFMLLRRYGLLKITMRTWIKTLGRSLLIFLVPAWLFVELITLLMAVQPQTWWAWAALVQFLFSILMARFRLRWLRLSKLHPLLEGEIPARLQTLLERLQLPHCPLFLMKVSHRTNAANAYFGGVGRGRRILLTDTMVQNFTLDEIEVILAHELGHFVHHDIWTRLVMRGLTVLGMLYVVYLLFASSEFPGWLPLAGYMLFLAFLYITMRYRRYQEYQADEFALQATGNVQAFKDAMTRLTNLGMVVAISTRRARHPVTHPTLMKRLRHADEFAAHQHIPTTPVQV